MSTASGNGKPALSASSDAAIVDKLVGGGVKLHQLETELQDYTRASALRRQFFKRQLDAADAKRGAAAPLRSAGLSGLPLDNFNAEQFLRSVHGRNCEAVVGYVPLPVGLVGPLLLDDEELLVPLATTEGALVASTNRGCRVISESGGARTVLTSDGMTRAPVLRLSSLDDVARLSAWVESPEGFAELKAAFDSTSKFARLLDVSCHTAGRSVYLRFRCNTGDAMGMNMISKVCGVVCRCPSSCNALAWLRLPMCFDATRRDDIAVVWCDGCAGRGGSARGGAAGGAGLPARQPQRQLLHGQEAVVGELAAGPWQEASTRCDARLCVSLSSHPPCLSVCLCVSAASCARSSSQQPCCPACCTRASTPWWSLTCRRTSWVRASPAP
jgi:hypothetical protein